MKEVVVTKVNPPHVGWWFQVQRVFLYFQIGIQILIIENVANWDENDSFKAGLMDRLRSNGYTVILRHQFNAASCLATNRNRLVLIAYHCGKNIDKLKDWKLEPVVETSPKIDCNSPFLMRLSPSS